jgi:predicted porin
MLAASPALAADKLGGNCCADLEERVAELEQYSVRKGTGKTSLTIFGELRRSIVWHDFDSSLQSPVIIDHQLNTSRESQLVVSGETYMNENLKAGFKLSIALGDDVFGDTELSTRENYLWIGVKGLGKVKWGTSNTAVTDLLAGTLSEGANNVAPLGSVIPLFQVLAIQGPFDIVNPFDDRPEDGVHFVSDDLGGIRLFGTWDLEDESWSAALRYAGEFGAIRIAGTIGYRDETQAAVGDGTMWGGSGSIMHTPSGLFLDGAYGQYDGDIQANPVLGPPIEVLTGAEITYYGGRIGIDAKTQFGKTTIFGEYSVFEITGLDDSKVYGGGVNVNMGAANVFGGIRIIDAPSFFSDEEMIGTAGISIKF